MWWTEKILQEASSKIKNKIPIVIPSCNSPKPKIMKILQNIDYPIVLFVRNSQAEEYRKNNDVVIVSMEDDKISDAGKTRREICFWACKNGYDKIFMLDDDISSLNITKRGKTKSGEPKSSHIDDVNICDIFAVWQLSMEKACEKFGVAISGIGHDGFSWTATCCEAENSCMLYWGHINQAVCLDIKKLIDNKIMYESSWKTGHEDIDLVLQCLDRDIPVCTFPFITYATPPMDITNFKNFGNTLEERFATQQKIMIDLYGEDYRYAKFLNKRGLDNIKINFKQYMKDRNIPKHNYNLFEEKNECI